MIEGESVFERMLPRPQIAPCWDSHQTAEAKDLQSTLERTANGDFTALDNKIQDFMKDDHFFRLTEGKFYEVNPGDYKEVRLKIQVKEGTITWYFANVGHDETTQEFRNQVFRSAALGHLTVKGACAKYYRGTNAMHVKRMHTSERESMINHNHYRVDDNHVTPSQFRDHLYGFLEAQKAYGIPDKFLTQDEADQLINAYIKFDESLDAKVDGIKTRRELFHERELQKWTAEDRKELVENKSIEEPCDAQEIIVPLNQGPITVEIANKETRILPKEWFKYRDRLDKAALDKIAKAGSEGQRSDVAHTRQVEGSVLPTLPNAYNRLGELFEKNVNRNYPSVEEKNRSSQSQRNLIS